MRRSIAAALGALGAVLLAGSCAFLGNGKPPAEWDSKRKTTFDYFGTVSFAVVYDDFSKPAAAARFESAWAEIKRMMAELEKAVGVDSAGGDIRRFNEARGGERVAVGAATARIAALAIEMHRFTGGAYNPAVAGLVDLWGFSPRFRKKDSVRKPYDRPRNADGGFDPPDPRYIDAFRRLSDFSAVVLDGNETEGYHLVKNTDDIEIDGVVYSLSVDFGGIAKGYGADRAAEMLRSHGYEYGYVNLGLSSLSLLKRPVADKGAPGEHFWGVDMPNPFERSETYLSVFAKDTGLSTSGTYDLSYRIGARDYSHLIDPSTGEPTRSDIVSATVSGIDAARADALATALCVMGSVRAKEFMARLPDGCRTVYLVAAEKGLEPITNMPAGGYLLLAKGR